MVPPKPCKLPFEAITRWQGMIIGIGFVAIALPAALAEFGLPDAFCASQA